jgi:hypothetical protein
MSPSELPELLKRTLDSQRVHSAYLLSGSGDRPRESALTFARALVCQTEAPGTLDKPCEECPSCRRSADLEPPEIDGTGKAGPLYRHIGDHPDLLWVDRGQAGTRVRIGQVRAIQSALRLGAHEGGRRVVVIADAEWLNVEAQNALLRLLEEPPNQTSLILVTASAAALLATIRSRCQRVRFAAEPRLVLRGDEADEEVRELVTRLDGLSGASLPDLLDWAEAYRGPRGPAAERVQQLLVAGSEWLRGRVGEAVAAERAELRPPLDAFRTLASCRRDLSQRNANPQMVAERAFLALRQAASP